jgi:peptidoglycan/xylan/chitin deacetylase (PgdA/CDA1 family)
MSKTKKHNVYLLILAALVAAVIYFFFMSEKAIAPTPEKDYVPTSVTPSVDAANIQEIKNSLVDANALMYHHIGTLPQDADNIRKGLTVSTEEFDKQLKYLQDNGYKTLTLGQLSQAIEQKKVPQKVAVLTFDDGYDDNYKDALPIMKKYNMVGTFFIITSKIGTSEYMSEQELKELVSYGNELGSHSVSHPGLDKLKGVALQNEVVKSKEKLEEISGQKMISFCYPAGKYNEDTIKALQDAGYKIAVTTRASSGEVDTSKLFEVSRYRISSSMSFPALLH